MLSTKLINFNCSRKSIRAIRSRKIIKERHVTLIYNMKKLVQNFCEETKIEFYVFCSKTRQDLVTECCISSKVSSEY
jgi:hypothetical protein